MKAMYFGCVDLAGHFLYEPRKFEGQPVHQLVRYPGNNPWGLLIDGGLCPNASTRNELPPEDQPVNRAKLHRKDGWTAIAWWDRTGDKRPNSNSVFMAEGEHDFASMLTLFRQKFEFIAARCELTGKIEEAKSG